jgi:hypothetical protein
MGLNPGESSVESFQINAAAGALVPVSGSFLELVSTPIGAAANPANGTFYVYLGPNLLSPNPDYQQDGDLLTYTTNPLTGLLGNETGSSGSTHERSFGADPLGRFVATGQGEFAGTLQVTSAAGVQGLLSLGTTVFADEIFVGPGEHFITSRSGPAPIARCTHRRKRQLHGYRNVLSRLFRPAQRNPYRHRRRPQLTAGFEYFRERASSVLDQQSFERALGQSAPRAQRQPGLGPVSRLRR